MLRKCGRVLFLIAVLFTVALWIHSHVLGWHHAWSDPEQQRAGRIVSDDGQMFVQICSLAPDRELLGISEKETREETPKDFVVGSDPTGEVEVLQIADRAIPFARPDSGRFFGLDYRTSASRLATGGFWSSRWHEGVVSYWVVVLLLVLGPAIEWIRRRLKERSTPENGAREAS